MTVDPNFAENHQPRVHLESYNERWPSEFHEEADRLRAAIGPTLVALEHIGSTAVPGLAAKPIIDILAGVSSWDGFERMVEELGRLGYVYTPHSEKDDPGRRVFRKGPADLSLLRTHNLHVTEFGSYYWTRLVAFRDHLRDHAEDAADYQRLKEDLVARYRNQTRAYTKAKETFVKAIEAKAGVPNERAR